MHACFIMNAPIARIFSAPWPEIAVCSVPTVPCSARQSNKIKTAAHKHTISYRKRVLQYCQKEGVEIQHKFASIETSKDVIIDQSTEQRLLLLWKIFNWQTET